jgi:hypothetical protein
MGYLMTKGKEYYVSNISRDDALKNKARRYFVVEFPSGVMWFGDLRGDPVMYDFAVEIPRGSVEK